MDIKLETEKIKDEIECVIRLQTSYWKTKRGIFTKKSLTFLKRKCRGFNFLKEDVDMIGAEELIGRIINFDNMEDGIYKVMICNAHRDWESGYIEDYDYRLIPYKA